MVKDRQGSKWICTYHIYWPEEVKFHSKDLTKKEAAYKAALTALSWLKSEGRLSENGSPIIYSNKEVKQLTKKVIPSLNLSPKTVQSIEKLLGLYENELSPSVLANIVDKDETIDDSEETVSDADEIIIDNTCKRRFLDMNNYLSKEKVHLPIAQYK